VFSGCEYGVIVLQRTERENSIPYLSRKSKQFLTPLKILFRQAGRHFKPWKTQKSANPLTARRPSDKIYDVPGGFLYKMTIDFTGLKLYISKVPI